MQQQQTQAFPEEPLSMPIKITESIFMADDVIAHDLEWLTLNQITHIINCAGKHCQNNTQIKGMSFLTFDWSENTIQNIIDQNVINASIGFIQEAKRQCGTVLIHGYKSQSRPFCILAIYLMIKYQWNIFKSLEFLNSRKEDTEVDSAFFQQLNVLYSKLQERGMIRSKQWIITSQMSQEEIILTNTFLNSRKKFSQNQAVNKVALTKEIKKKKKTKTINWKENQSVEHVYSSNTIISQINNPQTHTNNHIGTNRVENGNGQIKYLDNKVRSDSVGSKKNDENSNILQMVKQEQSKSTDQSKSITGKILAAKQSIKSQKGASILTEMNVTKKWTELREAWMKEKENLNTNQSAGIIYLTC